MDRRGFFKASAGMMAAGAFPLDSFAAVERAIPEYKSSLDLKKLTIRVGAKKKFSALHISDTHLTRVDKRNDERKMILAAKRSGSFQYSERYLWEALRYAREHDLMIIHTGDLIDFVSESNLDIASAFYSESDSIVSAGNHEYSQYVGEAWENDEYKARDYDKIQKAYPNDLTFFSRVVNGVNFVAVDDVYYNFTERQHELMEKEMGKGLPVVMLCHVPLYTPEHYKYGMEQSGGRCAYLTGVPYELTKNYEHDDSRPLSEQWRNRSVQQNTDKATAGFIAWLKEQKQLKAILCGHCHYFFEERFSPTAIQYTVGATYRGQGHLIRFV